MIQKGVFVESLLDQSNLHEANQYKYKSNGGSTKSNARKHRLTTHPINPNTNNDSGYIAPQDMSIYMAPENRQEHNSHSASKSYSSHNSHSSNASKQHTYQPSTSNKYSTSNSHVKNVLRLEYYLLNYAYLTS